MIVQELLSQIQTLGYRVELVGDNVKFTYTKGSQIPKEAIPILKQFKERKHEVVACLQQAERESLSERMAIMGENCEPGQTEPYVTSFGVLVIPFNSDKKYHYWKPGGQSLCDTLKELGRCDLVEKYRSIYN